jgi:hypothetical protein
LNHIEKPSVRVTRVSENSSSWDWKDAANRFLDIVSQKQVDFPVWHCEDWAKRDEQIRRSRTAKAL